MILGSLQESLITLLCYDKERASIIRNSVTLDMWGGPYRVIAARAYDYIDRYKKPPGDHLPDLLSDKLQNNDREAQFYGDIIQSIHDSYAGLNGPYIMARLETFIQRQSLRTIAIDLTKALQRDTDEGLEEAQNLLSTANKSTLNVFDPGLRLSDKKAALKFLDRKSDTFPTGIPELDKRGFGPTRKEMWLFVANTKFGKTFALIQLAKMAMLHRIKVCHISLEMDRDQIAQRYMQTLFAVSKRSEVLNNTKFQRDELGRITGFDSVRVAPALSLDDPKIRAKLERKIDEAGTRILSNIFIRDFPTGMLTVNQLEAYLDNLEATQQFVPDLLLIDYPDLFSIDPDNHRLGLDMLYKRLRGLAGARNLALAIVSQSHRGAAKAKSVGMDNVAEHFGKIAHADTVITGSQTKGEQLLGLARLKVVAGRNDAGVEIVISQQYSTGSFVIDSNIMSDNYWQYLPQEENNE